MMRAWHTTECRPTMDIDLLGKTSHSATDITSKIRDILTTEVEPDGLFFDLDSIETERIAEHAEYEGVRVRFRGVLDSARINIQIDIGFDDIIYPGPEKISLPTMLDQPAPKLLGYSRESVIAEKFEAMVKLGMLNSRMKDFYDICFLTRWFQTDATQLAEAIRQTFNHRNTPLPSEITAFTPAFSHSKQIQWTAFRKRIHQENVPAELGEVTSAVAAFLAPALAILGRTPNNAKKPGE